MSGLAKHTIAVGMLADLASRAAALNVDNLHGMLETARREGIDLGAYAEEVGAAFERASDDRLGDLAVDARARIEQSTNALRWIQNRVDVEIFNRAVGRRKGDESAKVSIPHERADIELVPEFSSYTFDVDALETVLPFLKEAERAKLLKIEPEREESVLPLSTAQRNAIISAIGFVEDRVGEVWMVPVLRSLLDTKKVERRVSAGATVSITAIADRYRGSNVEAVIRSAMKRDKVRDVLRVTPRTSTEPKTVVPA